MFGRGRRGGGGGGGGWGCGRPGVGGRRHTGSPSNHELVNILDGTVHRSLVANVFPSVLFRHF